MGNGKENWRRQGGDGFHDSKKRKNGVSESSQRKIRCHVDGAQGHSWGTGDTLSKRDKPHLGGLEVQQRRISRHVFRNHNDEILELFIQGPLGASLSRVL